MKLRKAEGTKISAIRGTIRDGQVVLDEPIGLPEGTRVFVGTIPVVMMSEGEQGDDPESIALWLAAFDALPVAAESPLDDASVVAWREAMRRHNFDAARAQTQEQPE